MPHITTQVPTVTLTKQLFPLSPAAVRALLERTRPNNPVTNKVKLSVVPNRQCKPAN